MLSGLDIHHDLGEGHPLLGRRMPDLDLRTAHGPTHVFTLLHDARAVLLDLGSPGGLDISPRANRVRLVAAEHDGEWELPVLGRVAAPAAVLIRPDGHVAWVGDGTDTGLRDALTTVVWISVMPAQSRDTGRRYLERGCPVTVLARWGPGGGPRNVLLLREDGTLVVRPLRGLRRPPGDRTGHD